MFTYNNVYYFRYTCVTHPHIFDQFPLMIPLEIRGPICLGINLHWIPGALRAKFVQVIVEMQRKCINQSMFRMWYRTIKFQPPLHFALGAIRKYYVAHCTNVRMVPQDQWDTLTLAHSLYKARYMQKSGYNPQQHIQQRGAIQRPNQPQVQPQQQQQVQPQQPNPQQQQQPQQPNQQVV
jgi:hypothetical protein